jgi:hypothetical protein
MTTTTYVSITCQACGLTSTLAVDALLVSVASETSAAVVDSPDDAGTVAWACEGCTDLSTARLDWPALLTLVTAGATLLDDATDEALPPHPEQPAAGAPLTRDDLLALHELLTTDTWFDQVTKARCVNP